VDSKIINAIKSHAWGWKEGLPEPNTKMEWALYTCDDLSGFIIACALVRPDPSASPGQVKSKLQSLTVESIFKKWPQKSFAAGVKREHVELCQEKLGILLPEFAQIALTAMQSISDKLGL
jgi:predicted hydrolase (HD superfamily)